MGPYSLIIIIDVVRLAGVSSRNSFGNICRLRSKKVQQTGSGASLSSQQRAAGDTWTILKYCSRPVGRLSSISPCPRCPTLADQGDGVGPPEGSCSSGGVAWTGKRGSYVTPVTPMDKLTPCWAPCLDVQPCPQEVGQVISPWARQIATSVSPPTFSIIG